MGKQTTPPSARIDLILADNQPNNYLRGGHSNYPLGGHGDNDRLFGVAGNDKVYSGDGNDYLAVQTGTDLVNGGTEADRFEFVTLPDSRTSGGIDTLVELNPSQDDLIEIRYLTFEDDGEYSRPISPVDQATDENDELKLTFGGEKAILSFVLGEGEVGGVDSITEAIIWLLGDHSKA